jgi:hypothetical protein
MCCVVLCCVILIIHLGQVDKEATIELFFPSDAMNDILKSINVTSESDKE